MHASNTKKAPRKKTSMVRAAITSSVLGRYQGLVAVGSGIPNVERPRARLIRLSKCSRAAVVAGLSDSRAKAVAVDGIGGGKCVERNI